MKAFPLPWLLGVLSLLCMSSTAMSQDVLWQTLFEAGENAANQGNYAEAERQLKGALADADTLKQDDGRTAKTLRKLAAVYDRLAKYSEAEATTLRLLTLDEKTLGRKHRDVAMDHAQLGAIYAEQGRNPEAESQYLTSIQALEKLGCDETANLTAVLSNLSLMYENQGKYSEAEKLLKRALALCENSTVPDKANNMTRDQSLSVATTLDNLAKLYAVQSRYAEAEPLFKRSLTIRVNKIGPVNADVARSLTNLGKTYQLEGKYAESESLLKRAMAVLEESKGATHSDYAVALTDLAKLYDEQHKIGAARKLSEQALAIQEKSLGVQSPVVAETLNGLARARSEEYDYAAAEPLYQRALKIDELSFGADSPSVSRDLNNLALLYVSQGRYAEAEPLYKRSLAIVQTKLGNNHPDVATCLNNLAFLYKNESKYAEAESLLKQGLAIREKIFGSNDRVIAQSLSNLASVYQAQGKFDAASDLLKRALAIDESTLSADHPHVNVILRDLAESYSRQKKYSDAEQAYRRLLERDERVLGKANPVVASDLDSLSDVVANAGNLPEAEILRKRAQLIKAKLPGYLLSNTGAHVKAPDQAARYPIKNKWALIIGISNFKDSSINLKYAAKDAADFRNYLVSEAHFQPDHIRLLTDKNASRENIVATMGESWLKKVADPNDLIVVYVSSHGTPSKKEVGGTNFLVPYEANIDNVVLTGIPMQWLTVGLKEMLHCRRLVLILDVCHSGAAATGDQAEVGSTISTSEESAAKSLRRVDAMNMQQVTLGSGQIVITSSGSDQISWESRQYPNSVFTRQLIEGLRLKGDRTTLAEAYDFMRKKVEEEVLRDRAQIQTPIIMTQEWDEGEVTLAVDSASSSSPNLKTKGVTNYDKSYERGKK